MEWNLLLDTILRIPGYQYLYIWELKLLIWVEIDTTPLLATTFNPRKGCLINNPAGITRVAASISKNVRKITLLTTIN